MTDERGTLDVSGGPEGRPTALEVLAGEIKFATTESHFGIGLLARPDLPSGFAVDKRVLVSPASSRLEENYIWGPSRAVSNVVQTYRYIEWAVKHTTDSDNTIVTNAVRCLRSTL